MYSAVDLIHEDEDMVLNSIGEALNKNEIETYQKTGKEAALPAQWFFTPIYKLMGWPAPPWKTGYPEPTKPVEENASGSTLKRYTGLPGASKSESRLL